MGREGFLESAPKTEQFRAGARRESAEEHSAGPLSLIGNTWQQQQLSLALVPYSLPCLYPSSRHSRNCEFRLGRRALDQNAVLLSGASKLAAAHLETAFKRKNSHFRGCFLQEQLSLASITPFVLACRKKERH